MKRIALLLLACALLFACGTPEKKEPENAYDHAVVSAETDGMAAPAVQEEAPKKPDEGAEEQDAVSLQRADEGPGPELLPEAERFPGKFSETPEYGERSYKSSSIDITITTYTVRDTYSKITSYHVADIYVKDVTSIRTAAARGDFNMRYERQVKEIADDVGALLAIDGDTYTHVKNSFIIRNGELYRDTLIEDTDLCVLYRDGRMETKKWGTFTMQEIIDADPWQVWGFGPALLDEDGHAMDVQCAKIGGHNPRAVIGYYEPGHYCFVIVDGRQHGWSEGVRLPALSRLMEDLGCKAAYNLDGGSSAQMYWNGEIISRASNDDRRISDIIYILPEQ